MSEAEARLVTGLLSLAENLASRRPLGERLANLCRVTTELLACDRSSIFLLREGYYRAAHNFGNPPDVASRFPDHRVSPRDPLVALAMTTRRHVIVNDVEGSPLVNQETARRARIRAIVLAPLFGADQQPLGFLTAEYNENPGHFTDTLSALVLGFAKLAEIAIVSDRRDLERQRAEEEKAAAEERLRDSQRLESLGRLAGGIAHDFNNLLTVILGHGDLLKRALRDRELLAEVEQIQVAADRAGSLTQQLLALGRRQILQPKVLGLDQIVRGLEPMLRRVIREDIDLVIRLAPDLVRVWADPVQMEQVVMNLVLNARDAMPDGGRLTIALENASLDQAYCGGHPSARPGPHALMAFIDTGRGMDATTRSRIFEPFFSTKPVSVGTGLGLSSVLGIVEQSGGHVAVESEPGRGTTFRVYLPAVTAEALELPPAPRVQQAASGMETVLFVDDDPGVRRVARRILALQGYTVLVARNGDEALARAAARRGPLQLLVTDVVMPGLGARQLAERLQRERPGLRVLYVSGHAENAIVHDGVLDPSVEFLAKPFTPATLTRRVREVLDAPRASACDNP